MKIFLHKKRVIPIHFLQILGVTLLELLIAMLVLGIIVSIAYPSYREYIEKAKVSVAIADIATIEQRIETFFVLKKRFPLNFLEIGWSQNDPWEHPYVFLNFDTIKGKGKKRKDKNLVPINSDYDLYSLGPDGSSVPPLTAKPSHDDIIRANNGAFIGVAEDY